MRAYAVAGIAGTGTADKTAIAVVAAATVRPRLYDLTLGNAGTPADQSARHYVQRFTVAGTATAVTPEPLDPGDVAAVATAGQTHTVEPTYTAGKILLQVPLNMRATFRWVASPGGELVAPATAANGLGVKLSTATATLVLDAVAHFYE